MEYKGDNYYIDQVIAGKAIAYSYIIDRHKDKAFNLAFRICGNREDAEEVAQDSFLKAYRSIREFRMKSSFSTWLFRIVYNTAVSQIRTRKDRTNSLSDYPSESFEFSGINEFDEDADREHKKYIVNQALIKLTSEERAIISLYYYDDMSIDEIAEVTGSGKSNIKVRLFRARQKMLEIIEKFEKENSVRYETNTRI
ncbi:MAG: RNA polymerase sigma factor [Bacteroidetes bacterium]|nr:RNA polymerase sigma factor [Bacteroidota bacterium]